MRIPPITGTIEVAVNQIQTAKTDRLRVKTPA